MDFRTSNHYLFIEIGRWNNIIWEDGLCTLCDISEIPDEFRVLFRCRGFKNSRTQLLRPCFDIRPDTYNCSVYTSVFLQMCQCFRKTSRQYQTDHQTVFIKI